MRDPDSKIKVKREPMKTLDIDLWPPHSSTHEHSHLCTRMLLLYVGAFPGIFDHKNNPVFLLTFWTTGWAQYLLHLFCSSLSSTAQEGKSRFSHSTNYVGLPRIFYNYITITSKTHAHSPLIDVPGCCWVSLICDAYSMLLETSGKPALFMRHRPSML